MVSMVTHSLCLTACAILTIQCITARAAKTTVANVTYVTKISVLNVDAWNSVETNRGYLDLPFDLLIEAK